MMKHILALCTVGLFSLSLNGQDLSVDQKLGDQYAEMVVQQMGIYEDPDLRNYVQEIVDRLTVELPKEKFTYYVKIVDQEEPNAFALPGGHVFVTRGLLAIVNTEDELAGIMGHEIIHAQRRHSIKQMKKQKPLLKGIFALPGLIAGIFVPRVGDLLLLGVETGSVAIQADYGRKHEQEADIMGVQLVARAGYDPEALSTALGNLSREIEFLTGQQETHSLLNDHPVTSKRLDYLKETVADIQYEKKPPLRSSFLEEVSGIIFGPNPQQGLTEETKFIHPDLNFFLEFGEKWKIQNTPATLLAYNKAQNALLSITVEEKKASLQYQAQSVADTLSKNTGLQAPEKKQIEINGYPGYQITQSGSQKGQQIFLDIFLVQKNGLTYQFYGVSYLETRSEVLDAVITFRSLSGDERKNINVYRITLEKSQPGETVSALNERVDSHWKSDFGAIVNGMEQSTELVEGTSIKILSKEKYLKD